MDDLAHRILDAINESGLSYGELAKATGIPKSALQRYAMGITEKVPIPRVEQIGKATGVSAAYLLGWTNDKRETNELEVYGIEPLPKMKSVPLVGSIACGTPITAVENIEDMVSVPWDVPCDFVLRCKGDSMAPRLLDGDLVFIRQQPDVHDGQIAVIIHDGEATLKHVYHIPGVGVQLVAENPAYPPMVFTSANSDELRIIGLAVSFQRVL